MARLSAEDLRRSTLPRQFPAVVGTGPGAVVDLFNRLGPIQSQVPRSPFLTASSRLPGVDHTTMVELFEGFHLLRASTLRGTVFTATRQQFGLTDTVARRGRSKQLASALKLRRLGSEDVIERVEEYADETWTQRADILAHVRSWLDEVEPAAVPVSTFTDSLIWGHPGLLRRPPDTRWSTRTDTLHRRARAVLPELPEPPFEDALAELVRTHLGAYGPAGREDIAFFAGARLREVDAALTTLGDAIVRHTGPDGEQLLDLAEMPPAGSDAPGVRLLPEFDGMLVGYAGPHRTRFLTADQLTQVWARANGVFAPFVLIDDRIVATWRIRAAGRRNDLEVTMLTPYAALADDVLTEPVRALEAVLAVRITDVRVIG